MAMATTNTPDNIINVEKGSGDTNAFDSTALGGWNGFGMGLDLLLNDPFFSDPFDTLGITSRLPFFNVGGFGRYYPGIGNGSAGYLSGAADFGNENWSSRSERKNTDVDIANWIPRIPRHLGSRILETEEGTLWRPASDVYEDQNDIIIHVDLPGVPKDEIKIDTNERNELTIHGEAKRRGEFNTASSRVRERNIGKFRKIIRLPAGVDLMNSKAKHENGLLEIRVPKGSYSGKRIHLS